MALMARIHSLKVNAEGTQNERHLFGAKSPADDQRFPMASRNAVQTSAKIVEKGWSFLRVSTRNTFPWIRENDLVFVRRVGMESMARGDIAAFENNGAISVRRVLSVVKKSTTDDTQLITRAHAAEEGNDPAFSSVFRGRVEFLYRGTHEIRIAAGWRRVFSHLLALISFVLGRFKPFGSNADAKPAQSTSEPSPRFAVHHPAEDSAD